MCGFCGVIGPSRIALADAVAEMARTLEHRGPDDFGTWDAEFRAAGGDLHRIALGHTRLSILDLSPLGHQPMLSEDGAVALVYNGEIYNYRALREELRRRGLPFRSGTDSEVLLQAWRTWGLDALPRLVGMFAFAVWDGSQRQLLLARDRIGIKPLYWRLAEGVLSFGSELRALRRHPGFRAEIDRGALGRYLRRGYTSGTETIYRHVHRLPPGGWLLWEDGRLREGRYWSLEESAREARVSSFPEAVDRLEALLGDAVESRLVSDVPLGAFLSGGVDSSAVVALMRERARGPVRTFSIGFRERAFDEAPFARGVAKHFGTEHTELYVEREHAVEAARSVADVWDEPFADSSAIPTLLLSRLTREHVTVALSGDGGDELFGGYDRYAKLVRLEGLLRLPGPVRRALVAARPLIPSRSLRNGLRHVRGGSALEAAESLVSHFAPEILRAACGERGARPVTRFGEAFQAARADQDLLRRFMVADAATYLPDDILTKVDRASMSVGLEARVPLLDHRGVEFALGLPRSILWESGRTKAPLRELLYRRVPRRLIERPKQGFGIPLHTLLAEELRSWTAHYLAPQRLAEEGLFDPGGVQQLVAAARGADRMATTRLWCLLCFERWFARTHRAERDV